MPRKLIVNADGFGFTFGNNRGIFECLAAGVVKSVSVNTNFPAFQDTPRLAEEFPGISIGIHLDLTVGPCAADPKDVPDLVDSQGQFLGKAFPRKLLWGRIPHEQILRELTAQVECFRSRGIRIDHWDSHQNMHLHPRFARAALEVAGKYGIERMRTHDHYLFARGTARAWRAALHLASHPRRAAVYWYSSRLMRRMRRAGMRMADRLISPGIIDGRQKFHRDFWLALLDHLPEGISEVCCHPGYPDETLMANAAYVERRRGVELISFRDI